MSDGKAFREDDDELYGPLAPSDVPPLSPRSCEAATWEGKPCRKTALDGSPFCDTHQPQRMLNRKMRRGLKYGAGNSAQLDHGVRQGG
jgi:hypothetical protein